MTVSSNDSEFVECELQTYPDFLSVEYTCLSYVWGPEEKQDDMHVISINNAQFRIR